jgi:predicted O-methyltransferase YrrM
MMVSIERALQIQGWMAEDELQWLAMMASAAQSIVEVGGWKGRTTVALADNTPGRVFMVDNWCDPEESTDLRAEEATARGPEDLEAEWRANLADYLDEGKVVLVKGHSPEVAPFTQLVTGGADFVFIDAGHALAECLADLRAYQQVVRPGGILAGHDYTTPSHPGVREAVDATFAVIGRGPGSIWWVRM